MKNKNVKKLVGLFIVVVVLCFSISCKGKVDLAFFVSSFRQGVYEGSIDDYKITAYTELREEPFLLDGFVGEKVNVITIKLEKEQGSLDGAKVRLNYGENSCEGTFDYNPLNGKFICEIEVENLPTESNITAIIKSEEIEKSCQLTTKKLSSTITQKEVLNMIKKQEPEIIKNLFENNNVTTEIHVRLIAEENKNYYYVGLVQKDGKIKAFLLDGSTGEILAKRTD